MAKRGANKRSSGKRRQRRERGRASAERRPLATARAAVPLASPVALAQTATPDATPLKIEVRSPRVVPGALKKKTGLRAAFGLGFWVFFGLAALTGGLCYRWVGEDAFVQSLTSDTELLIDLLPRFAAALLIAGFAQALIPRDALARFVGAESGMKGLLIATVAGAATPGGPMTSYPIVRALHDAGTGRSPLVAYITSWTTLGFQRAINWELPLMGVEFCLVRILASLPLPIIAAFTSKAWPADKPGQGINDG